MSITCTLLLYFFYSEIFNCEHKSYLKAYDKLMVGLPIPTNSTTVCFHLNDTWPSGVSFFSILFGVIGKPSRYQRGNQKPTDNTMNDQMRKNKQ